ncbi:MAG: hypothetical protein ABIQ99_10665 [Thermoflexales bacterium]
MKLRRILYAALALCAAASIPVIAWAQTPSPTSTPEPTPVPTSTFPRFVVPTSTFPRFVVPTNTPEPTATFPRFVVPTNTPEPTATPVPPTARPAAVAQPPAPTPTLVPPTATSTSTPAPLPTQPPSTSTPTSTQRPPVLPAREPREISRLDPLDPDVILVTGTVCFDENGNGKCDAAEAPVRETRVTSVDGSSLSLTDDLGQYVLRARAGSGISVVPPVGYRALTSTLPAQSRVDFVLVADRAALPTSPPAAPTLAPTLNTSPGARISELLIYVIFGGLIILIILSNLRISGSIDNLRKTQLAIAEQTSRADLAAWRSDLEQRIQHEWGSVAGQQIADLLGESIRINERMGITGVAAEPAPRFAVTDARGRKFIFTTSLASLRELGIIGWRDRVARVTESGSVSMAQALWDYVATHGQINIVVPRSSPWYMAVRDPARSTFDSFQALKRWSALRAVQRAVRNTGPWRPPASPELAPSVVASRAAQSAQVEIDLHPTPSSALPPIPLPPRPPVSPTALTEEVTPISVDRASEAKGAT